MFLVFDLSQSTHVSKYKVQPNASAPVDRQKLLKAFNAALINQWCVNTSVIILSVVIIDTLDCWDSINVTAVPSFQLNLVSIVRLWSTLNSNTKIFGDETSFWGDRHETDDNDINKLAFYLVCSLHTVNRKLSS